MTTSEKMKNNNDQKNLFRNTRRNNERIKEYFVKVNKNYFENENRIKTNLAEPEITTDFGLGKGLYGNNSSTRITLPIKVSRMFEKKTINHKISYDE